MTTSAPVREPTNRCPFCGTNGRLTKEHVWPQWLRSQGPAYGLWAPHYQGERSTVSGTHAITNDHGLVEYVPRSGPAAGKFLATVTVKVCGDCNRQWNERLEKPVQELLRPAFTGETTPLTPTYQRLLALWAVKCFVAYARATTAPEVDPFPESERRRQAKPSADPNDRWDLWIGWSPDAEAAHMALSVRPTAFTHRDDDLTQPPPNNTANCWLGANGAVVIGFWRPPKLPREITDLFIPAEMQANLTRLWPKGELVAQWPNRQLPADTWDQVHDRMSMVLAATGLPEEGLTVTQRQLVAQAFLDGALPWDLRRPR